MQEEGNEGEDKRRDWKEEGNEGEVDGGVGRKKGMERG